MTDQMNTAELTAEETAYFESGGETLPQETATPDSSGQQAGTTNPDGGHTHPEDITPSSQDRDERGRFVPHQALHAEREEHKKTKAELEEIRRNQAVLNDRWNTLLSLKQQQEQPKEQAPPDPENDIFGYTKWQAEQLNALKSKIEDQEKQATQRQQIEAQEQELWNDWSRDANAYAAEKPEFGDAISWLSEFRNKQLEAMAIVDERFSSPAARNEQINAELRSIVMAAKQKGQSPAQLVHNMALAYGFAPKAPDPTTMQLPDKLATVASAQAAAKTVGQAPGRAGGDALTPESIAAMSPAEFDRWAADPKNSRLLDQMLGA